MIIYSVPTATTPYRLDLPEIGKAYWLPDQKILENEYIATSTASAGFFRQLVKYDVSSIKKEFSVILDSIRAAVLYAMLTSSQTSWYCDIGTAKYHVNMIASMEYLGPLKTIARFQISVIEAVA